MAKFGRFLQIFFFFNFWVKMFETFKLVIISGSDIKLKEAAVDAADGFMLKASSNIHAH